MEQLDGRPCRGSTRTSCEGPDPHIHTAAHLPGALQLERPGLLLLAHPIRRTVLSLWTLTPDHNTMRPGKQSVCVESALPVLTQAAWVRYTRSRHVYSREGRGQHSFKGNRGAHWQWVSLEQVDEQDHQSEGRAG